MSVWQGFPMAYLTAAAGGLAFDGVQDVLELQPHGIHQRSPIFLGSQQDVEQVKHVFSLHA
jgi:fructose-1,6-bisphosphatase I